MFSRPLNPPPSPPRRSPFAVILPIILSAALAALFALAGRRLWHYFRYPDELKTLVSSWGLWAPLGIILFQVLQVVLAPLPGNLLAFIGGYALGLWPTIIWLMIGVLLGATIAFLLSRLLGRRLLQSLMPARQLARFDSVIIRRGTFYIFLLLLIPNPLGDWIYYLAGLTPLPLPLFLALVFVARLPSNILECSLGATAKSFRGPGWLAFGLVVIGLTLLYYFNQHRIEALIERLTHRRPPSA